MRGKSRAAGTRTVARALVRAVAVGVLAGCGGLPDPVPTPGVTDSTEPTPTVAGSPSPSDEPEPVASPAAPDLSVVSPETAAALAVYFVQLYPYVYATGDLTAWQELSHPECVFCASVVSNAEQMIADGQRAEGGTVKVLTKPTIVESDIGRAYLVQFRALQVPGRTIDPVSGSDPSPAADGTYDMDVLVFFEAPTWTIRAVTANEVAS